MPESPKKSTKPLPVVRAAGVLLYCHVNRNQSERSFLLMRHANRWDLPKGHCDGDETFLQTAIREMEEETGIAPEMVAWDPDFQFDLRYHVNYRRHGNQVFEKHVRYFLGQVPKKMEVKVTEHESFKWLPWDPPHQIQAETIDPLLAAIDGHWDQ